MPARNYKQLILLFLSLASLSLSMKAQVQCGLAQPYLRIDTLNINLQPTYNSSVIYNLHLNWDTSTSIKAQAGTYSYNSPISGLHSDVSFYFQMIDTSLQVGIKSLVAIDGMGGYAYLTGANRLQANTYVSDTSTFVWSNISSVPINRAHYSIFSYYSFNFYDKYLPLRKKYGNEYLYGWILATGNESPSTNNSYPYGDIIYQVTRFPKFTLIEDTLSCAGTYTFSDGLTLNNLVQDTVYDHLFSGVGNAYDSLVRTRLHVLPIGSVQYQFDTICQGNFYLFPDGSGLEILSNSYLHVSSFSSQNGCDSLIYTYIQTNPVYFLQASDSIDCDTDYGFPDGYIAHNIHQNITHSSVLLSSLGCDSVIGTHLFVRPASLQASTFSICSGNNYTFPDGTILQNIVADTIQESHFLMASGCDSVLQTHLIVQPVYFNSNTQNICSGNNYTFPDGTILQNIVADTIQESHFLMASGCDSVLQTHLIVQPIFFSSSTQNICYGSNFTFPDGTTLINIVADTIQLSHLQTVFGCDSLLETHLMVQPIFFNSNTQNICSGSNFTFPDGTILQNVVADTIQESHFLMASGCDSVLQTHLMVQPIFFSSSTQNICYGSNFTFPNGTTLQNIVADTIQDSHLQTALGCDSILQSHLIVQPFYISYPTQTICSGSNFNFPDGTTLQNIVVDTVQISHLQTVFGCDSDIFSTLQVHFTDTSVQQTASALIALANGVQYQWWNCDSQQIIPGATQYIFHATHAGHYAVIINDNICTDTSSCYTAYNLGWHETEWQNGIMIFPNPTHGRMYIRIAEQMDEVPAMIKLYNTLGYCVKTLSIPSTPNIEIDLSDYKPGIYYLKYKQWVRKICIE